MSVSAWSLFADRARVGPPCYLSEAGDRPDLLFCRDEDHVDAAPSHSGTPTAKDTSAE